MKVLLAPKIKKYKISNNKKPKKLYQNFYPKTTKKQQKNNHHKIKTQPNPKSKGAKDVF
ncbi:hypothetical protein HGD80_04145 [Paulownia witches'-broom phytoplasma]|uniref:Uncharacterized protein n=1 Tax=Paulownia witches'-broom phytoplasma TaxID=39647 RepID=A0ABX8TPQ2_9MOLU|nr:hypothetical protein [Paulownia witches'-broom phytoplasma]QYC30927.1 hypothetical protein HGD80_04145 [Paulownia witches'-broom phytoplasma]